MANEKSIRDTFAERGHNDLDRMIVMLTDYINDTKKCYNNILIEKPDSSNYVFIGIAFLALFLLVSFILLGEDTHISVSHMSYTSRFIVAAGISFITVLTAVLFFRDFFYGHTRGLLLKDNLLISRKRLHEVMKFTSQYLENKELTDIRKFELKLLLTEADDIYLKTEKYVTKK